MKPTAHGRKCKKPADEASVQRLVKSSQEYPWVLVCSVENMSDNIVSSFRDTVSSLGCSSFFMCRRILKLSLSPLAKYFTYKKARPFINGLLELKGSLLFIFARFFPQVNRIIAWTQVHAEFHSTPYTNVAPSDVVLPQFTIALQASQTSFFNALNIPTRIMGNRIQITREVSILHKGQFVSPAYVDIFKRIDFRPFKYSIKIQRLYFDKKEVNVKELEAMKASLLTGLRALQALSVEIQAYNSLSGPFYLSKVLNLIKGSLE
eukprot:TRINITY_DN106036_c0_g1_i1.p1 TRINITY_DN106036_c0_g1~~TRINITY_DN106036_c0_g1_i1.p1  ORF type:complete len:296 (-),score=1.55 TRINITY_DN106036_c0_g1_i1:130-918(-)